MVQWTWDNVPGLGTSYGFHSQSQDLENIVLLYKQLSICISDENRKGIKD